MSFKLGESTQDEEQAAEVVDLGIEIDGDVLEVAEFDTCLVQAILHRLGRQTRPMLDAPEAFFFDSGDELTIPKDGCGGVAVIGVDAEN